MDSATFSHSGTVAGRTKSCKSKAHLAMDHDASCSEIFWLSLLVSLLVQLLSLPAVCCCPHLSLRFLRGMIWFGSIRQGRQLCDRSMRTTARRLVSGSMAALQAQTSLNLSNKHPESNEAPSTVPNLCWMPRTCSIEKYNNLIQKWTRRKRTLQHTKNQRITWVDVTNRFIQHKPLSAQAENSLFGVTAALTACKAEDVTATSQPGLHHTAIF